MASLGDGFFLCRVNAWADGPAAQRVFHLDDFAACHEDGFPHFEFFDSKQDADACRDIEAEQARDDSLDQASTNVGTVRAAAS